MKNNKLLIILVGLAAISIISYVGDFIYYRVPTNNYNVTTNEIEPENKLEIYIYNSKSKDYDVLDVKRKSPYIDEGDYVNAIIDNMDELDSSTYKFLAAYNIKRNSKNTLIIKLSRSFNRLNKTTLNNFINSVKKTINTNFNDIEDIIIEVDSN